MREGRIWRQTSFDLGAKVWQISGLYVLLLCALAGGATQRFIAPAVARRSPMRRGT